MHAEGPTDELEATHDGHDVKRTTCCIVGGGPAGAVLGLLLARKGVNVTLLEAHPDFDREFRGDTIHPSVMEIMDQLGLAERLLELRHTKVRSAIVQTVSGPFTPLDFSHLKTKFPYITMMPQTSFLEFITGEAERYPNFHLSMGARVRELVEEDGVVRGVRYEGEDGWREVRAVLIVGADGRGSRVRRLAGFEPVKTSPPMDVLWFKLPREEGDPEGAMGRVGRGHIAILLDRYEYWQAGYVIPKGTFPELRQEGIGALRRSFAQLVPEFADRVEHLEDWKQVSLLSVESSRCPRWYRPGMLLIGDASHVMSPVGGVGINYAIQDAVVAANVLAEPLKESQERLVALDTRYLAAVQRRRELPTRFIQAVQTQIQRRVLASVLRSDQPLAPPSWLRLLPRVPLVRSVPARIFGLGLWPVRVKNERSTHEHGS
ncbi:MAG: FAD-dependent oxidoreductase [Actinomycetota bacterium]|nr:FAD-dependent oxidoreductase [Actinomycetota bacterium]